jgi:hypothetical protein
MMFLPSGAIALFLAGMLVQKTAEAKGLNVLQ